MKVQLIVAEGKREGKVIPIPGPQFTIGRHQQCHLRAASPLVSQHHCALLVHADSVSVRDFDSVNGTFVNDEPVSGEREVRNADCLKVGPLVFLLWIQAGGPAEPAPARRTRPKPSKASDESSFAALLLEGASTEPPAGILGVEDDSGYGSTVLKSPAALPKESGKNEPRKHRKTKPRPQTGGLPEDVRRMLAHYKRRRDA